MSAGEVVGLVFAVAFCVLVAFLCLVLLKLTKVLGEAQSLVAGITKETVPLLGQANTSVGHVNDELVRVEAITGNVQSMTGNLSALTSVFAATLGGPVVKVAAFSYGVRKAAGKRNQADVEKRVKAEIKAEKRAARAARR